MGLRPDNPDFLPGTACDRCEASLFNGDTPLYVEAWIMGIGKCPFAIGEPPNANHLLIQNPMNPCQWMAGTPPNFITWNLLPGHSIFSAGTIPFFWFFEDQAVECVDAFDNQLVCGIGPTYGAGGFVLLFWGPGIGPIS